MYVLCRGARAHGREHDRLGRQAIEPDSTLRLSPTPPPLCPADGTGRTMAWPWASQGYPVMVLPATGPLVSTE